MEERIVAADPVLDPQGYQRELLALLRTSDPLEVMGATLATFRERTAGLAADPDELQAVHRQVRELWESMDRTEARLRSGSRRMSPLLWLE